MGMKYDLFKPERKERFDLGKGMWCSIFDSKSTDFRITDLFNSNYDLYCKLLEGIASRFDHKITLGYFDDLAKMIIEWCGDDIIQFHDIESFNEEHLGNQDIKSYDCHEKKFPYTGSRYIDSRCN